MLLAIMLIYHYVSWLWLQDFKSDRNDHSHVYYRWMNEVPVIFLVGIIMLAIVKPF